MIAPRVVAGLGLAQLVCWGVSYYLIGGFGEAIATSLGWSRALVHGGFSASLLVMGAVSPLVGRAIDRSGGRVVMTAGSCLTAVGCAGLALAHSVAGYYAAWICLGAAMRCTLYDAAFAALARIDGPAAARPMAQITLLGGLASTVFWPLGHELTARLGWRGALGVYAGVALLTVPLHLSLPATRGAADSTRRAAPSSLSDTPRGPGAAARAERTSGPILYAAMVALIVFLNSGMSAHMIDIFASLGLGATASVWLSSLRGIGQSSARLGDVLFGRRVRPLDLNLMAALGLPIAFAVGLAGGRFAAAAAGFALLYGAANGISTITRGTLPLVLFDHARYGALVGRLLVPSFLASAAAPLVYAVVLERFGGSGALWLSLGTACLTVAAAAKLKIGFG